MICYISHVLILVVALQCTCCVQRSLWTEICEELRFAVRCHGSARKPALRRTCSKCSRYPTPSEQCTVESPNGMIMREMTPSPLINHRGTPRYATLQTVSLCKKHSPGRLTGSQTTCIGRLPCKPHFSERLPDKILFRANLMQATLVRRPVR